MALVVTVGPPDLGLRSSLLLLGCSLLGASSLAQSTERVDGWRSIYDVTPSGTAILEDHAPVPLLPPAPSVAIAGALWSRPDQGENWIGRVVSLGNHGTEVFTEFDTASDRSELLSGFDVMPVTPVWDVWVPSSSQDAKVDAANDSSVFVSCRQIPVTGSTGPRNVIVSKYTEAHTSEWSYTFPGTTQSTARVMISKDGQRIVAGMLDSAANLEIAVFDVSSNVPISFSTLLCGPQLRAFLLSSDGSTVYWASGTTCNVWDVATHSPRAQFVLFQSLDCHAISGDGSVFAYGGFNTLDIFERQTAGNYVHTFQWNEPGQAVCGRIEISDDSSTLVTGFNIWDLNLGVRIRAIDLPTKTVTMSDAPMGGGTLQNIVSDIAVSENGSRFVVGLWGDEAGLCPELRLYRRDQDAPVALYDYPGSIFDVDISPDGKRVAAAAKAVHANTYAGGGRIDLYSFDDEDFVAHGVPTLGDKVRFSMSGTANSQARLLISPAAASVPFRFQNVGTLYLNRNLMYSVPIGTTDAAGSLQYDFQLTNDPSAIGSTLCFQGFSTFPRRLTNSWVELTVLP
jgi:hypothetical protein